MSNYSPRIKHQTGCLRAKISFLRRWLNVLRTTNYDVVDKKSSEFLRVSGDVNGVFLALREFYFVAQLVSEGVV